MNIMTTDNRDDEEDPKCVLRNRFCNSKGTKIISIYVKNEKNEIRKGGGWKSWLKCHECVGWRVREDQKSWEI